VKDRSADVSGAAARSLGALGAKAKSSVPALVTALDDPREHYLAVSNHFFMMLPIRCDAAEALGRIGIEAKAAIPALRKMLVADRDPEVRGVAALAVLRIDPQDQGAIAAVIKELDRKDKGTVGLEAAIQALSELGPRARSAVPALIRCLKHEAPSIRAGAAEALASIGDRAVIPDLAGASEDEDSLVRDAVEKGLGKLRHRQK
jgi:HEAT repeat protein